jgi:hypothetical protein
VSYRRNATITHDQGIIRPGRGQREALVGDDLRTALKTIERADPDGGSTEPAEDDYVMHRRWAIERYGRHVWDLYMRGGWDYLAHRGGYDGTI